MINYKGYVCEIEYIPLINNYMWHIKKDDKYIKCDYQVYMLVNAT